MRICTEKVTGKLIEMQSDATEGTLIKNAVAAGYAADDVVESEATDAEFEAAKALTMPPPTFEKVNAATLTQIKSLEADQARPLRELALGDATALARVTAIDDQIKALRAQLIAV